MTRDLMQAITQAFRETTIADVRPNTLPAGTLRVASDGDEWLVLVELFPLVKSHTCDGGGMPWSDDPPFEVFVTRGWRLCGRRTGCPAITTAAGHHSSRYFDTRQEADTYFDQLEAGMRGAR